MRKKILSTVGGSLQVLYLTQWQTVIDSNNLPAGEKHIYGIQTTGEQGKTLYEIKQIFQTIEDLVSYLNSTFVLLTGLSQFRLADDGFIDYDNSEAFSKIEIIVILQTTQTVFKVGAPGYDLNIDTVDIDNGNNIINDILSDEVISVKIGVSNLEPSNETGYNHSSDDNSLFFQNGIADCYVYVVTKQSI
jgi:hypothetical protein